MDLAVGQERFADDLKKHSDKAAERGGRWRRVRKWPDFNALESKKLNQILQFPKSPELSTDSVA